MASVAAGSSSSPPVSAQAHQLRAPLSPKHLSRQSLSSSAKLSPLLSPQTERRISLVSLGAPVVSGVPSSPTIGSRIGVPSVRDLRASNWQNAICGMNPNLVHAIRAAVQGQATVSPDGRVEGGSSTSRAVTPTPSTPLSPRTPRIGSTTAAAVEKGSLAGAPPFSQLDLQRRQSHSSTSVSSAGNSTPSTPRQGSISQVLQSATAPELLINRQQAFHQLLLNLVSYLPPLPASLLAPSASFTLHSSATPPSTTSAASPLEGGSSSSSSSTTNTTRSPSPAPSQPKRVYVGLSVGPSAGKIYFEERMLWPVASSSTTAAETAPAAFATPTTGGLHTPGSPPILARPRSATGSCSSSSPIDGSSNSMSSGDLLDDSVALSVYLLLDPLDIDSKQVTFVGSALARAGADTQQLLAALYKRDFTVPNHSAKTGSASQPLQMHHASSSSSGGHAHTGASGAAHTHHQSSSSLSGSTPVGGRVTPTPSSTCSRPLR